MTIKAGVLSDTHLIQPDHQFRLAVKRCFADCRVIIHAGDLTDLAVLEVFTDKIIHAVHGNMCHTNACRQLPTQKTFQLGDFSIGLTHGAGLGYDIESALRDLFPDVDCMIYGHTHQAVCRNQGNVLIVNPGSFQSTGRFGAHGTYGVLEAGDSLHAQIFQVPTAP
ncbi:MAG: YfcE family phosphodiesterase [Desulfobulbaceae bacterium]|nr:YfcE family phosphodiesterase [Desulfobulbaceae bacterium]